MDQTIASWVSTVLCAKVFADSIRRDYGFSSTNSFAWSRNAIDGDGVFAIILAVTVVVVRMVGVEAALPIAILVQCGKLANARILIAANHSFLELFVLILLLRLLHQPDTLASVMQLLTVSVWLYSAFQKLYHRQFLDGSFFYLSFQNPGLGDRYARFMSKVSRIDGYYAVADAAGQTFCRRLALVVFATEVVTPLVALAINGTPWSVLVLLVVSLPVGLVTKETNFMITNIVLATFFLVSFDSAAFSRVAGDPIAFAITTWCLVWPPLHAVLTRRLRFSSWKLAGWGMYATQTPKIDVIGPEGQLQTAPTFPIPPFLLLQVCGTCDIGWLRNYAHREFFRCHRRPAKGLAFRWYQRRGDKYVTRCMVVPNASGARAVTFDLFDEHSVSTFKAFVSSPQLTG